MIKKSNYVKRCVGIPGDILTIKNSDLYVNGKLAQLPERAKPQFSYKIAFDNNPTTVSNLDLALKEANSTDGYGLNSSQDTVYVRALTQAGVDKIKTISGIKSVAKIINHSTEASIFPYTKKLELRQLRPYKSSNRR